MSREKADRFDALADEYEQMERVAREHRRPWDHYVRGKNVYRRWAGMYRKGATTADVFGAVKRG